MEENKRKYIPIIGGISAGKSTFLQAFLGINVLETGETTTTRFICLNKNSNELLFYHIIPKKDKEIYFEKEGEEVKGEDNIKKKIEEINRSLSSKKVTQDEIFYILETPIKNIENIPLLDQCYFMDIPGLDENKSSYIDIIFPLISIEDILFEIFIFDSTSFCSDSVLTIFKRLQEKNCLKKKNNLFILNKIDYCKNEGEENIIDKFKQYFYETFEDEKNNKVNIFINIYENYFVPMNSLLYMAETKINDDFSSLLLFELFNCLEFNNNSGITSFYDYIAKKTDSLINNLEIQFDDNLYNILNSKMNIISDSVEYLKKMISKIRSDSNFQLGINLNRQRIKREIQKLYYIHKNKKYFFIHSKYYNQLQKIIKNYKINESDSSPILNDLSVETPYCSKLRNESLKKDKIQNYENIDISTIEELEIFLNETFKVIDPKNELGEFKISLQSLRENILGRKLRIALIGNINVGKSTVLNCIIGRDILPTRETECTYRGIIIRHENSDIFKLYKTNNKRKRFR